MVSVVIPTHESERLLVPTLAALVPAALAGVVREVIVADAGSSDETARVADIAGCRFEVMPGPPGARLAASARLARSRWLMFLRPGSVPTGSWIEETDRFLRESELVNEARAAVFRPGAGRSPLAEALALAALALGARPDPAQGLLIEKALYEKIGGHRNASADPEAELLRKLGRRRIVMLGCEMAQAR